MEEDVYFGHLLAEALDADMVRVFERIHERCHLTSCELAVVLIT